MHSLNLNRERRARRWQKPSRAVPVPPGPVPAKEIKPAPPTPIAVKKVELGSDNTWDPQWDVLIEENLPGELMSPQMSKAVHPFCPRFGQLSEADKRAFWAYLFQALAGAEAGLKPTADVKHLDPTVAVRDSVSHRTVRQQGLLQLTYEDSDRYSCNFDWEKDKNLPVGDPDKTILQPEEQSALRPEDHEESAGGSERAAGEPEELLGHSASPHRQLQGVREADGECSDCLRGEDGFTQEACRSGSSRRFDQPAEPACPRRRRVAVGSV